MVLKINHLIFIAIVLSAIAIIMPVSAFTVVGPVIDKGATLFVGEEGLNLNLILPNGGTIGYWAPGTNIGTTSPLKTIVITPGMSDRFSVTDSDFADYLGPWYDITNGSSTPVSLFWVDSPKISLDLISPDQSTNYDNATIAPGQTLTFKINTNLYKMNNRYKDINRTPLDSSTGFVNIKVTSPDGGTYTSLAGTNGFVFSTQNLFIDNPAYIWPNVWNTGAIGNNGLKVYLPGTYSVNVESVLNNMNNNFVGDKVGNTISENSYVILGSESLQLTLNKDSVTRSSSFAVTIIGQPNTHYNLWVKDTNTLSDPSNHPPTITPYQEGVEVNDPSTGNSVYQNSGGRTISQNVPSDGGPYYANVTTSTSGSRVVQFDTGITTKPQVYTIRVEQNDNRQLKYDQVLVSITSGALTIVSQGSQSYFIGETIKISGTNTDSTETFLFVTGPNLPANGAQIESSDPRNFPVINGDRNTFHIAAVDGGDWSWDLSTAGLALDAGTYTIFAVSNASDRNHLQGTSYGTLSITLQKPFVSAVASQPSIAKGDDLYISGTAEGTPSEGVAIWIIGKNYANRVVESTDQSSRFNYKLDGSTTSMLTSGQYFVIVQHPMQNGQFDIVLDGDGYVRNMQLNTNVTTGSGTTLFKLTGTGSLQGSDGAEALIAALDDPNVDDTYTRLQFVVEEPIITIDPIGDKHIGDKFTITAKTNLAIDDQIDVQIYSSSFTPTSKTTSGEFSGATGTVRVIKNNVSDLNTINFDVDTSTFKEDEYVVTENSIIADASGSGIFNVLGGNFTPGSVNSTTNNTIGNITTIVPTTIVTTAKPTPIPTTKSPGFGAILALAGLVAVGFIVVKRQ